MNSMDKAAGVAWWSSALTPSREGARSIPNPSNPFPTLGIGASLLFRDLAGSVLFDSQHGSIGSKKWAHLAKIGGETAPEPDPQKKKKKLYWQTAKALIWSWISHRLYTATNVCQKQNKKRLGQAITLNQ